MELLWTNRQFCEHVAFQLEGLPVVGHFFKGPMCVNLEAFCPRRYHFGEDPWGWWEPSLLAVSVGKQEVGVAGALTYQDGARWGPRSSAQTSCRLCAQPPRPLVGPRSSSPCFHLLSCGRCLFPFLPIP